MQAELAAIEDPDVRRQFARSAAWAAFSKGLGLRLGLVFGAGLAVAAATTAASRLQLADGRPGVLAVTVPIPALVLLVVSLIAGFVTASFRGGLSTGSIAGAVSFACLFGVLAVEGEVWMKRHGVFILDADPPRDFVDANDVMLDIFTTGMWIGHALFWLPAVLFGASVGSSASRFARRGGSRLSPGARPRP